MYYRGANAAIIVYDITNNSTYHDVKTWLEGRTTPYSGISTQLISSVATELKKNAPEDLPIYIVGSKADLAKRRMVT
jgi:GTPase SAR1 family protein